MRPFALAPAAAALLLQAAPALAEQKIGYVDFHRALNEVEEGKVAKASLKAFVDEKQKLLDKDKADLEKMQAEFEKQQAVLSDEARRDKAQEVQQRMMEAQGRAMTFQKELSERERDVTRGITDKMVAITREIADAEGFTIVFEKTDAGIIHAPASLDLTNELIRKYNGRHKPAAEKKKGEGRAKDKEEGKKAAPAK